jgi:hypothetical protein
MHLIWDVGSIILINLLLESDGLEFTIASRPFKVPIAEHAIIVKGESSTKAKWSCEALKFELYTCFPQLRKTKSDCKYDHDSRITWRIS